MKKAKIMLTALCLTAVVGGAVAFKAQKAFNGDFFCTAISNQKVGGFCSVKYSIDGPNAPIPNLYCTATTALVGTPCTYRTTLKVNQ